MSLAEPTTTTARRRRRLLTGGTDGNERLTAVTGSVLLVLLAVLGITILRIGQLMWLHLFLGIVLFGPIALKISSTGYRFVRYYTGAAAYRRKGPPPLLLRALGPMVVLSTCGVFLTGLLLLVVGPHAGAQPALGLLHKVTFIIWLVAMAPHVLGHLAELPRNLFPSDPGYRRRLPGSAGRQLALLVALAGGLVLAVLLLPEFSVWTFWASHHHHHHG
jgi:hypothetical protein